MQRQCSARAHQSTPSAVRRAHAPRKTQGSASFLLGCARASPKATACASFLAHHAQARRAACARRCPTHDAFTHTAAATRQTRRRTAAAVLAVRAARARARGLLHTHARKRRPLLDTPERGARLLGAPERGAVAGVYALQDGTGRMYVGKSQHIAQRVQAHRAGDGTRFHAASSAALRQLRVRTHGTPEDLVGAQRDAGADARARRGQRARLDLHGRHADAA